MRHTKNLLQTLRAVPSGVFAGAFVALFAAANYLIYMLYPLVGDDLWYAERFFDYVRHGAGGFPWREIAYTVADHFEGGDNVRLANIVLLPLLALPRWMAAIVPAGAVGALLLGSARLASSDRRLPSLLMLTAVAVCLSFMLPWQENFFQLCFALNYVVPAAMMVWFLVAFFRGGGYFPETTTGAHGRLWRQMALLNAMLLGAFNEAVSLPTLTAVIIVIIFFPTFRSRRVGLLTLALIIGVLYVVVSRVTILSFDRSQMDTHSGLAEVVKVVKLQVPLVIFIAALMVKGLRCGWRSIISPVYLAYIVVALVSIVLNIIFQRGERISVPAHVASICGFLNVFSGVRLRAWLRALLVGAGVAILAVHYVVAVRVTAAVQRQWTDIVDIVMAPGGPPSHYIFSELTIPESESMWAWRKPGILINGWMMTVINREAGRAGYQGPFVGVVPEGLRHVTADSGEPVPGGTGIRKLGKWYFSPYSESWPWVVRGKMGPFTKDIHFRVYNFMSEADGREYFYMHPQNEYFPSFLLPIDSLDSIE